MSLDEIKPSLGHLGDVETLLTSSDAELSSALSAQTDAELVDACRRGEPGAWELLIRRHAGLIYTIARRYGLEADEAADVFQMVCVELWEQLNSVRDASLLKRWTAVVASR